MHAALARSTRLVAVLVAGALAACGGGSSGTSSGGNANTPALPQNPTVPAPTATAATTCTAYGTGANGLLSRLARPASNGVVPDLLYVTYRGATAARGAQALRLPPSVERAADVGRDGALVHRVLHLAPGADAAAVASSLRADPDVANVAPVHARTQTADAVANDPYLETTDQWYLYRTAVDPGAWSQTHGSATVKIAVIDTGVDETNRDLAPLLDFRESVIGGVVKTGAGTVQDTDGHGTNVAGLAAAQTDNGYGFAGVGYATHLLAFKVFPDASSTDACPGANTADEARAIRDAVAQGASVINLSLGSPQSSGSDQAESDAVAYALANGVAVVAAAGNEYPGTDGNQPDYPAAYPGVIAVGASAVQDSVPDQYASITSETVASYSNSGATLVAPGGDANGTNDSDTLHWVEGYSTTTAALPANRCTNGGGVCRALFNGTSQATPQVSGTIALMMARHGGPRSLTPAQVTSILRQTADALSGVAAARQGAGRLNAANAVTASR